MSRSYFSSPRPPQRWFRAGNVDVTTTVLLTAMASLSVFVFAIDPALLTPIYLETSAVTRGQIWRLLTWPLANLPALQVVISILIFWYFSSNLERLLGRTRFLWFALTLTMVPALGSLLLAILLGRPFAVGGIAALADGVVVAYVAAHPTARSFFDIPLWLLCAVILGLDILQYTGVRAWSNLSFLVLMIITALVAARSFGISMLSWIPSLPLPSTFSGRPSDRPARQRARAAKLRVVQSSDLDSLLDKIAEHGLTSLTAEERRRLDELSGGQGSQSHQ